MTYVQNLADGPSELDRVYGLRKAYYELFMQDYNRSIERVDPVLIEVCRLRMAKLLDSKLDLSLRYKPAVEAGLTEDKVAELSSYYKSPQFTERERRCIDFAEQFTLQSSAIDDEEVRRGPGGSRSRGVHLLRQSVERHGSAAARLFGVSHRARRNRARDDAQLPHDCQPRSIGRLELPYGHETTHP